MRIIDYLDALNWTQTRLAQEAHVSTATVQRLVQSKPLTRPNIDKICDCLTQAMGYKVTLHDVNEMHRTRAERPESRKSGQEGQQNAGSQDQNQGDQGNQGDQNGRGNQGDATG